MLKLSNSRYFDPNEIELVRLAQIGDENAIDKIIGKYKGLIICFLKRYFIPGADSNDTIQEGLIGLFYAIRDFDLSKKTPFSTFAELCIERYIIAAVKKAMRRKHGPLNTYISLSKPIGTEEKQTSLSGAIADKNQINPEDLFIQLEVREELNQKLRQGLSELEELVLDLYLEGKSYEEIFRVISLSIKINSPKAIDNAMQRVKGKIRKVFQNL